MLQVTHPVQLLLAAGSIDPDPAHAPKYGWPVAVIFGFVVVALVAWTVYLHRGWGGPGKAREATGRDTDTGSAGTDASNAAWQQPVTPARRGGLFHSYQPAVPPQVLGPFAGRAEAETRKRALDEEFCDYLNSWEGFFEVRERDGHWEVVRTLGRDHPRPVPGAWSAGLGP